MESEWECLGVQKSGLRSYIMYKTGANEDLTIQDMRSMCARHNNYRELYMSGDCLIYKQSVPRKLSGVITDSRMTFAKLLNVISEAEHVNAAKTRKGYLERERNWREWYKNIQAEISYTRELATCVRESILESECLSAAALSVLYTYQVPIVKIVQCSIRENVVSINCSDTGTGKTIMTLVSARELGKTVVCVAPKTVLTPWRMAGGSVGVTVYVNNYEQYKNGNTPFLTKTPGNKELGRRAEYKWNFPDPENTLLVFDEAHKIKNVNTENFNVLCSALTVPGIRIILLSATITDTPDNSMSLLYTLGIVSDCGAEYKRFLTKYAPPADLGYTYFAGSFALREPEKTFREQCLQRNPFMTYLSTVLYPKYGARLQIKDCIDFPMNVIQPILCDIPEHLAEIREIYRELQDFRNVSILRKKAQITDMRWKLNSGNLSPAEQVSLNKKIRSLEESIQAVAIDPVSMESVVSSVQGKANETDTSQCALTLRLRARQRVELLKSGTIVNLAVEVLSNSGSPVIFVCFTETLRQIRKLLIERGEDRISVVHGQQTLPERDAEIARFQADTSRVIIVNIYAGGTGASFHDLHGNHPRRAILTITDDAVALVQGLGRIPRIGAKSSCIQYILYCAGTVEEAVHANVCRKVNDINTLNDSDLSTL